MKKLQHSVLPLLTTVILLIGSLNLVAQHKQITSEESEDQALKTAGSPLGLSWEELGPNNMGTFGREILYQGNGVAWLASMGGGLWKSTNNGITWNQVTTLSDELFLSSLAMDGSFMYAGSGEMYFYDGDFINSEDFQNYASEPSGEHRYVGNPGSGVWMSSDGGVTWSNNNATWTNVSSPLTSPFSSIQKVIAKNGRVIICTMEGLYYSDDNLSTVTKATGNTSFTSNPILDAEFGDGTTVWAATADSLWKSSDNGATFGDALNKTGAFPDFTDPPHNRLGGARIEIAVSPSVPQTVYVTGANSSNFNANGVWKTTNNGGSWTKVGPTETPNSITFAPLSGNGRYSMVLAVDPAEPANWTIAGQRLYNFNDTSGIVLGASTTYFPGFSTNYVAQPMHDISFDPNNPDRFLIATDEQVSGTSDGGQTYAFRNRGFSGAHCYTIESAPNWKVIASEAQRGVIYKSDASTAITARQFTDRHTVFGKAGFSLVNFENVLAQDPTYGLVRSVTNGQTWESFFGPPDSTHPSLGTDSLWVDRVNSSSQGGGLNDAGTSTIRPWIFDEVFSQSDLEDDTLIMAQPSLVYMASRNFIWLVRSPFGDIDSVPKWTRVTPSLINIQESPDEYITALAVSGDTNHVVFAGTNHGKLYRVWEAHKPESMDVSAKFMRMDNSGGNNLPKRWITEIAVDPNDPNNVVVTYGSYDTTSTSNIYISNDAMNQSGTPAFRTIGETMSEIIPVYSAAFHPDQKFASVIVGTLNGVYTTTDDYTAGGSLTWNKEMDGINQTVPVMDVTFREYFKHNKGGGKYGYGPENTLFIATKGRGVWKTRSVVSRQVEEDETGLNTETINSTLYPNPLRGSGIVRVEMPANGVLSISIYTIDGRKVLDSGSMNKAAGTYEFAFDGTEFEPGIYLVKVRAEANGKPYAKTLKAVIVK